MSTAWARAGAVALAAVVCGRAGAQCPANVPHLVGTWTTLPYGVPVNPISATLLHTGHVLIVAGSENDANNSSAGADTFRNALWDPAAGVAGSFEIQNTGYDLFCSGTAQLIHGRTVTIGGTATYGFTGESRASFFDPVTEEFVQTPRMADGRWYATATALADGRVMTFSGLGNAGTINKTVEIYDPANAGAGWGTPLIAPFTPPLFPRQFLLPNGKVFFTAHGAGSSNSNAWIFDPAAKTWAASVPWTRDRRYGSAVLLPLRPPSYTPKVMMLGGGSPVTRTTETVDLSAPTVAWTPGPDMSTPRIQMNAVLLPNGNVLAEGGSAVDDSPDTGGKSADLYDPAAGIMRSAGTSSFSRLYHSVAILLPDATVASLGSNPGDRGKYLGRIEIYTPPYLYDADDRLITADRPAISSVSPAVLGYGGTLTVDYSAVSAVSSAVLVRPGSTTHAFDMDQRVIGLCGASPQPPCAGAGSLSLTMPPNGNLAPPGFYMLFLLDAAGVPSKAAWIELAPLTAAPPDGTIASPASDVTVGAGGTVFFDTASIASKYAWVFPGGVPSTSSAKTPGNVAFPNAGVYRASLTVIDASNNSDASPPTRDVTVLPTSPDFEVSVTPASRSVVPGGTATYTVTVTPLAGFGGAVWFNANSEGGLPAGVTSGGFVPDILPGSGTTTLTMNTTTAALPYAVTVTIKGTSGSVVRSTSATLLVTLPPPDPVTAAVSDSAVTLSWPAVPGAAAYRVSRSPYSGGPYQSVGCPSGTTFTDSGLSNGTTYHYVVSSTFTGGPNGGGAGAHGTEIAVTPPCAVPAYAGRLAAAKPGPGDVLWTWSAGGAAAFELVRGDLDELRSSGGDFTAALAALPAAEAACLADDTTGFSLADPYGPPAPGRGYFTLLRAVTISCAASGSFDEGQASQAAGRDAGIGASPRACP